MSDSTILDFNKKRSEAIEQKRRSFERIFFQNFLGAYTTIDDDGTLYAVSFIDISKDGCAFQIPWTNKKDKRYSPGDILTLRLYFAGKTYIPITVEIKNMIDHIEQGTSFVRYGCAFDQTSPCYSTLEPFIEFIYRFAEHSVLDTGDVRSLFI